MLAAKPRGTVFRCPVCGAEVSVIGWRMGDFTPRCCNTAMVKLSARLSFYVCPVCGAEIGVLTRHGEQFRPRCCNTDMILEAAA